MLLIVGDKGHGEEHALPLQQAPALARHGSCSMMVNFDAIGRYTRAAGGTAWRPSGRPVGLHIGAFLFGIPTGRAVESDLAYLEAIDSGGPDDFFAVQMAMEKHCGDLNFDQTLAYLRMGGWDAYIFRCCLPAIRRQVATASPECLEQLRHAIALVDAGFLPTGEQYDLAFNLGLLWLELNQVALAAGQFEKSLERHGPESASLINLAICLARLGKSLAAREKIDLALAVDPSNPTGQQLRSILARQIAARAEKFCAF